MEQKNEASSKGISILEDELQKKIEQLNQFDKDYIKIVSDCSECGDSLKIISECRQKLADAESQVDLVQQRLLGLE